MSRRGARRGRGGGIRRARGLGAATVALILLSWPTPPARAQSDCALARGARPKIAFLNYFWYRPAQFACTLLKPRSGPIDSADTGWGGYYHRRFQRLAAAGVDVLGFVFTGFDAPDDDVDGDPIQTQRDGRSLGESIWLARDVGLPFFIYYDLKVRTAVKSHRCRTRDPRDTACRNPDHEPLRNYNLKNRVLYRQLRDDLLRIKDDFILPHRDTYYMLEDEAGEPILDEAGLPRPVIGIYIARNLTANRGLARLVRSVTRKYRRDGLGQPAFVLDVVWWYDPVPEQVVRRFGASAAAVTSFFPVGAVAGAERGVTRMSEWVPHMRRLYRDAADEIDADGALAGLQVWPGIASQFDNRRREKRRCRLEVEPLTPRVFWHLESAEDWRRMLRMGYDSTRAPRCEGEDAPAAPQTLLITYENEFRESAVADCVRRGPGGRPAYPFEFGCELLKVVGEEDRWP